jgi:hypothetical protein
VSGKPGTSVERTFDPTPLRFGGASSSQAATLQSMGVDHGGFDLLVAGEFLDGGV